MKIEKNNSIENMINNYINLLSIEKSNLLFFYKGLNVFDKQNKNILTKLKKKNISISLFKKNKDIYREEFENKNKNIICPECNNLVFINIIKEKMKININCKDNHRNEYTINEFIESQNIKERKIKCSICNNDKYLYNNNFYICTCGQFICQLCMNKHIKKNNGHNIIYYCKKYLSCIKHSLEYVSYCSQCK